MSKKPFAKRNQAVTSTEEDVAQCLVKSTELCKEKGVELVRGEMHIDRCNGERRILATGLLQDEAGRQGSMTFTYSSNIEPPLRTEPTEQDAESYRPSELIDQYGHTEPFSIRLKHTPIGVIGLPMPPESLR